MLFACDQKHSNLFEYIYWPYGVNSPHNSKHLLDIYSLTHIFFMLLVSVLFFELFGYNKFSVLIMIFVSAYFEFHENKKEQILKYNRLEVNSLGNSTYRGDSVINIVGDILANFIGIFVAYYCGFEFITLLLIILFAVITAVTGFSYWTDFFNFLVK